MKVLFRQFLGKNHSWSVVGWGLASAMIELGHQVDLFSTDGINHLPKHLESNLIGYHEENSPTKLFGRLPEKNYDCQISYTAMKNFPNYLSHGNKNRFGIWCYEWAGQKVLPNGFAKHYKSCDYILAPSNFAKKVFLESKIPEDKIKVISHGINKNLYKNDSKINLPTNKKIKLLSNIAQNHLRKNIPGLLEAYGKAFTKNDDICLILKGKEKKINQPFEISISKCLQDFYKQFPDHAEVKLFSDFIEDISILYRSVDALYSLSNTECFLFPALESIASGKMVIAPNWGGQIDFLNSNNSLLIDGAETKANPKSMYWENKNNAIWFEPCTEDAAIKLRYAYDNHIEFNFKVQSQRQDVLDKYDWKTIANQVLALCI